MGGTVSAKVGVTGVTVVTVVTVVMLVEEGVGEGAIAQLLFAAGRHGEG